MLPNHGIVNNFNMLVVNRRPHKIGQSPAKYTVEDWAFNNNLKFNIMKQHDILADKIIEDSKLVIDEVSETTKSQQREVEHQTKQRTDELRFVTEELAKVRKAFCSEIEAMEMAHKRTKRAIEFLKGKSLAICQQCVAWREARIGVEYCDDDVDRELCREMKIIKGCQQMMNKTDQELKVQICQLRSVFHKIDTDMGNQEAAVIIDEKNSKLKQGQLDLGIGIDLTAMHCQHSLAQWISETYRTIDSMAKELSSTSSSRAYIDLLLKQLCEDLRTQTENTNLAFERRLEQVKFIKKELEDKHKQTSISILKVQETIRLLEEQIKDKERALLLCRTRLSNRTQRAGIESACDLVHVSLLQELSALQATLCKLSQKLAESKAILRYLQNVQLMQEEEINLKANDIKIDEVDCVPLRLALIYTEF